jgi:hypothetical protein
MQVFVSETDFSSFLLVLTIAIAIRPQCCICSRHDCFLPSYISGFEILPDESGQTEWPGLDLCPVIIGQHLETAAATTMSGASSSAHQTIRLGFVCLPLSLPPSYLHSHSRNSNADNLESKKISLKR